MGKRSAPGSLPSAEHIFRDGVEGKVCRGKHSRGEAHWVMLTGYWSNDSYVDGRAETCAACYTIHRRARAAIEKPESKALTLRDPRAVVFDDLGTRAHVGWYGDAEYFPITPLLALTKYTTEHGLLGAVKADVLVCTLAQEFVISLPTGTQAYRVWCLPWSHFSVFCLKFGNAQTKPQQERAQKVLEMAFGHTAESNQIGAARIDQGDRLGWEDNRQRHDRTHKMLTEMRDEWRGATHYKDRVLVIRGAIYFKRLWPEIPLEAVAQLIDIPNAAEMWRRGYRPYTIGKTGKREAEQRTKQYGGKPRMKSSPPIAEIHVDDPDEAERILKRTRPRDTILAEGCEEVVWAKPSVEDRIRRSWAKHPTMAVADLEVSMRGWEIGEPVYVEQSKWC